MALGTALSSSRSWIYREGIRWIRFFRKVITVTKLDADVAVAPATLVLDYDGYRNIKIIENTNRD